jgi:hypothetical protein
MQSCHSERLPAGQAGSEESQDLQVETNLRYFASLKK